jgi:2-phospho-L-lactate guanylyltransferase (CobY/MobA/RfbA family)
LLPKGIGGTVSAGKRAGAVGILIVVAEESMMDHETRRGVAVVMLAMTKSAVVGLVRAIVVSPIVILAVGTSVLMLAMLVRLVVIFAMARIGTPVVMLAVIRLGMPLLRLASVSPVLILGDL